MIPSKKISSIEFGILTPKMIRQMSVIQITTPELYDDDGYPIENGPMDPRLGVIDPGLKCMTCGGSVGECLGHFGNIELVRPVVHVGYAKEIYSLLKSTCRKCGRLLISEEAMKSFTPDELLAKAENISQNEGACPHCGEVQKKILFIRPYNYQENENKLLVTELRERFEKIQEKDLEAINFKVRPEWFILPVIPVVPITIRPSITLESIERSEDDLTHKLVDILRINQRLEENINSGAPQLIIEDLWDLLQYHVATYFDNGMSGIPPARHRSGRPLKTIAQRLKGKEGRFRNNLSGKRVNFSARTVISPDPNISINEVGVPYLIAKELTIPEQVNARNIDKLKKMVLNFPEYPCVKNVIVAEGGRKRVMDETKEGIEETLKIGDVVERTIQDGDVAIFNRQPSLHIVSMMTHKIKVLPYKTFRLNTAVCAPYNADFDGDEMNLHILQSQEAIAEAEILMKVQENIISPRFGMPLIGGRHDHVTGAYLLTRDGVKFTRYEALELVKDLVDLPKNKKEFTGKEVFSLFLPKDLTLSFKTKVKVEGGEAVIEKGVLKKGVIDSVGMGGDLLSHIIFNYGNDAASEFIDKTTILTIRAFMKFGFSTGIVETDLSADSVKKVDNLLDKAEADVDELIKKCRKGKLVRLPGKTEVETLEDNVMSILGKARSESGKIAENSIGADSSAVIMARIGARGSLLNLTQMAGAVGQQAVRGKRMNRGYYKRTLSHYKKGDVSSRANGFVRSSFKRGLDPDEYFFHAMGGRESLVDTAVRTGRSGYMQRRLINALQDLVVYPDMSVRGDGGLIVQFKYGEDGVDPRKTYYLGKSEHKAEWFT